MAERSGPSPQRGRCWADSAQTSDHSSPRAPECLVTTSWDDGHGLDCPLAELLHAKKMEATFYVPRTAKYRQLSDEAVRDLSTRFEIGAHSLTHAHLDQLDHSSLTSEIEGSKAYIEDVTGNLCRVFGYPYGNFNVGVIAAARRAGFNAARTVRSFCDARVEDPYLLHTTIQACTLSPGRIGLRNPPPYTTSLDPEIDIETVPVNAAAQYDWATIARRTFDLVRARGGTWHLWGHSWEVDACDLWDALSEVLDHVRATPGVRVVSNGELVRLDAERRKHRFAPQHDGQKERG